MRLKTWNETVVLLLFLVHFFFLAPFHSGLNYVPQRGEYTAISILCAALVRLQSRLQRLTTRWALLDATAEKHGRKYYVVSQGPLKKWMEHFQNSLNFLQGWQISNWVMPTAFICIGEYFHWFFFKRYWTLAVFKVFWVPPIYYAITKGGEGSENANFLLRNTLMDNLSVLSIS
jgi:hypothetical protein